MTGDCGSSSLRIRLLGSFRVEVDGRSIDDSQWQRRRAKRLVELLALRPGHRMHRDQAMECLCPESAPPAAANHLNKAVHLARRVLEPDLRAGTQSRFLHRDADSIRLVSPGEMWVDVQTFEVAAARALEVGTVAGYEAALAHYGGDLLDDDPYEEWLWGHRERLRKLQRDLVFRLVEAYRVQDRRDEAIQRLNGLLAHDPADEAAHRELMALYAAGGQRSQALRQYQRCRESMRRVLEAEPDRETVDLYRHIARRPGAAGPRRSPDDTGTRSLAVLPFRNETGDPELEYLCDGLTESLIHRMARLPSLRVMARSTVFRYRDGGTDPEATGRALGVDSLLLGRVARWSERLVFAAELVDVGDGSMVWGERYRKASADIFAVQEEIAESIVEGLRLELSAAERRLLHGGGPASAVAYDEYLKGRFYWNRRTAAGLRRALEHFRAAIREDPAYALAYSGLADCYNLMSLYGVVAPGEAMPKARAAAQRALEIDDGLAESHTSLAYTRLYYDRDWEGAERGFRRALELNPGYATAHHWYHELLNALGRFDEEYEQICKAKDLDPLSPIINTEVGWGLYFAREHDRAREQLAAALRLDPRFAVAHLIMGLVLHQQGRTGEAIASLRDATRLGEDDPFPLAVGALGHVHASAGATGLARQQLEVLTELSRRSYVSACAFALVHVGLGESDRAVEALRRAYEDRDDRVVYLNVEPMFDPIRSHAGFRDLVRALGLREAPSH